MNYRNGLPGIYCAKINRQKVYQFTCRVKSVSKTTEQNRFLQDTFVGEAMIEVSHAATNKLHHHQPEIAAIDSSNRTLNNKTIITCKLFLNPDAGLTLIKTSKSSTMSPQTNLSACKAMSTTV